MKKIFVSVLCMFLVTANLTAAKYKSKRGQNQANAAYTGQGGETKEVVVKGMAQITKAGEQDAFDRALAHAMRTAVETVLGSMIQSTTLVENSKLVEDKIYSKSSGFVQKYEIMDDSKDGSTKIVQVKAWVVLGDVTKDAKALGLLQEIVGRPFVMVLVEENSMMGGNQTAILRTFLQKKLMDKEFQFVEEQQIKAVLEARKVQSAKLSGTADTELAAAAVDAGAQLLVKGKVGSTEQSTANNPYIPKDFKSVRSIITIDVLYAADGTIIASQSADAAGIGLNLDAAQKNAIDKAVDTKDRTTGKAFVDGLVDQIIKKWDDMVNNGFDYTVVIAGVSFSDSSQIKQALEKNVEGVKGVIQRSFTGGTLTLLVKYSGESTKLAGMMEVEGKMPFSLAVQDVNSKSITLSKK